MAPRTRYARSGDLSVAYHVVGDGPVDLIHAPPFVSHLEHAWEEPRYAHYLLRLARFSRLILFDKRGTGLSDRTVGIASLEERMDDVRAVMDAVGSQRAVLYGVSESAPMACLFAATYPARTVALILYGAFASEAPAPDYPWPPTADERAAQLDSIADTIHESWGSAGHHDDGWGVDDYLAEMAPSVAGDAAFRTWFGAHLRLGASPGAALALARMDAEIDVRHILPSIRVPTLVLHRQNERHHRIEESRYVAANIPGARLVQPPGSDYLQFVGEVDELVDEIEAFVTGTRPVTPPDSVLATVMVIEVVGAAARAIAVGDRRWGELQDRFQVLAHRELTHFRGRTDDVRGARIVATFDGPARAIRCAAAIGRAARSLGLLTRAGLHTGECELRGEQISGVAVPLAAWVARQATPNQILVTSTVKDLVAGAELRFTDQGSRSLTGRQGEWRLFAVLPEMAQDGEVTVPSVLVAGAAAPAGLTRREREVAGLVARGLSNRQIAEALFIGHRTVETHVASILAKWELSSRVQLARTLVAENGRFATPQR